MRKFLVFLGAALSCAVIIGMSDAFAQRRHAPMMKCEDHFTSLDANKDGSVTLEEFSAVRHPRGNAKDIFKMRDANSDGSLTVEEFCERGKRHKGPMGDCDGHFKSLDTDKDGKVSLAEFKNGRHPRGNPEEMFKLRDADKDGFLTNEEFCKRGMRPGRDRK